MLPWMGVLARFQAQHASVCGVFEVGRRLFGSLRSQLGLQLMRLGPALKVRVREMHGMYSCAWPTVLPPASLRRCVTAWAVL